MKINYIKNKFLLGFTSCAMLLGLSNSSVLAQTRKPTAVELQKARADLNQQLQSLKSSGMGYRIEDHRTSEQINNRDNFVNAWKQVDSEVSPFLGSWKGYETFWNIYPSNNKGRICVISGTQGFLNLYFGMAANNELYFDNGKIIANHSNNYDIGRNYVSFQEGNYMGIGYVKGSQFMQLNDIPLNSPTIPEEPHLLYDMDLNQLSSSSEIVKSFRKAGCTASLPDNNTVSSSNLMTWQEFKTFAQQKKLSGLDAIIPSQFPNQFADGQVAMTMLSNGGLAYVVAKEGVNIPNLSSVKELRQTDGSFSAVDLNNAVELPLPALKDVPESLYNSSQLIEITNWASRYDDEGLRDLARQSEQTTLPNGQKAYYLKQGSKQGWCTFTDESAQYSDYLCVNIANSPKTSLEILKSILPGNNSASNPHSTSIIPNLNGLPYQEARNKLITLGWKPDKISLQERTEELIVEKGLIEQEGYEEVRFCSATGLVFCEFQFVNDKGEHLTVTTQGQLPGIKVQKWEIQNSSISSETNAFKPQIKIPDSFKLIMENGMKTEFIKGDDGYYTWLWNDRPGNCFGLKDNKDPAKVQLATYRCNSKKKARTWEILMANDNTGYKVKLPNTSYCLSDNIGIIDCNDSKATVINLTAEQLKSWISHQSISRVSTQTQVAKAEPASVFKPILADIQSQLPQGWVMRLPSKLKMTNSEGSQIQIYSRFDNKFNKGVAVFLDTQPNCQVRACSLGLITMAREHDEYNKSLLSSAIFPIEKLKRVWQVQQKDYQTRTDTENQLLMEAEGAILFREKITLAPGVEAHYVVRNAMGASTPAGGAVIWEQDGFFYSVRGPGWIQEEGKLWKTQLIDIARSMATEELI